MDLVLRLRELRRMSGLSQTEVARRAGVGVKTISSFETGARIESMKISQLQRILRAYGATEMQFFREDFEAELIDGVSSDVIPSRQKLAELPRNVRAAMVERIELMIETACVAAGVSSAGLPEAMNRSNERRRWSSR